MFHPELLSKVDLSNYQNVAQDKVTYLCDLVTQVIPDDPIIIYYDNDLFRVFSEETFNRLKSDTKKNQSIVKKYQQDTTGVLLLLEELADDLEEALTLFSKLLPAGVDQPTHEEAHDFINKMTHFVIKFSDFNAEEIINKITIASYPWWQRIFYGLNIMSNEIWEFEDYLNTTFLGQYGFQLLPLFHCLFLYQTSLFNLAQGKLRKENGDFLQKNEIKCPTRDIINLTRVKKEGAAEFLSIVIYLMKLTKLENDDIDVFLEEQPQDYLAQAEKKLIHYLNQTEEFNFSEIQHLFLNTLGIPEVKIQMVKIKKKIDKLNNSSKTIFHLPLPHTTQATLEKKYNHLWNDIHTFKENVSKLFSDYSKLDPILPNYFKLFITGHWNRHHHSLIIGTMKKINATQSEHEILALVLNLEENVKKDKNFNPSGSLARRIDFLKYKLKQGSSSKPVILTQEGSPVCGTLP